MPASLFSPQPLNSILTLFSPRLPSHPSSPRSLPFFILSLSDIDVYICFCCSPEKWYPRITHKNTTYPDNSRSKFIHRYREEGVFFSPITLHASLSFALSPPTLSCPFFSLSFGY
jgi:hypothetical protein